MVSSFFWTAHDQVPLTTTTCRVLLIRFGVLGFRFWTCESSLLRLEKVLEGGRCGPRHVKGSGFYDSYQYPNAWVRRGEALQLDPFKDGLPEFLVRFFSCEFALSIVTSSTGIVPNSPEAGLCGNERVSSLLHPGGCDKGGGVLEDLFTYPSFCRMFIRMIVCFENVGIGNYCR